MSDLSAGKKEATIRDFLNVIFRRKFVILSIILLTTFAVVYLQASQPQTFQSSARILVQRGQRGDVFSGRPTYLTWTEEVSSQMEVILSEAVFEKARRIFADSVAARGLPDVLVFNPGSARAEVVGESNVFVISYSGYDADECQVGCNAVTEAYKEYYRERAAPPSVSDYFHTEIEDALTDLEAWRVKKSEFLNSERYVGLSEEAQRQTLKLSHLEIGLADVETELSSQAMRVKNFDDLHRLRPDELEANLAIGGTRNDLQTAIMRDIKASLQDLRLAKEELLNKYTPRHPDVVSIEKQMQDLLKGLKQEVQNAYDVEKAAYDVLVVKRETIAGQLRDTQKVLASLPDKEVQLSRIENKIETAQTRYDLLMKRQNEAEIAVASKPEWEITVLSSAGKAWPRKTKDYVRLALGPFLALIVGLGVAFFFESLDHSLKNIGEVEEYLGTSVLATFTDIERRGKA